MTRHKPDPQRPGWPRVVKGATVGLGLAALLAASTAVLAENGTPQVSAPERATLWSRARFQMGRACSAHLRGGSPSPA